MDGQFQNSIIDLPSLNSIRYENIFKLYKNKDNQYYYNLLQSLFLPDNIDETKIYNMLISSRMPWTTVSFNAYKTIELWWLVCLTNQIYNPVDFVKAGSSLKIIKTQYVPGIIYEIKNTLATK
jgi:hypothetical protein